MARILVVGGSLGGLLAANILLRAGHEVQLVEKVAGSLDGRGAGIVTHEALFTGLRRAGVTVDETVGVAVASRRVLAADGSVTACLELPQILTSWSRLYRLLRAGFPDERVHGGLAVHRVEDADAGLRVHCAPPAPAPGDLRHPVVFEADAVVASDGIRSAVRQQLLPQVEPAYAGYVAWRGVCDEALLSRHTRETAFGHFAFGLPAGEQFIGYPVAGPANDCTPGHRRFNFVWYRAADDAALQRLMTDADGVHHALGIPPNKVSWREIAAMREAGRALLAPQFAEVLEKTAQPFLQPICDLASPRVAHGRIALMGDAAFVARPHVGMGVTKAAEDAMALADALAVHGDDIAAAWRAYEAARLGPGEAVVRRARRLGAYMQAQGRAASPRLPRRTAEGVLADTAIDLGGRPWSTWDDEPPDPPLRH
ncbi:FAD binding domain-containing protein [Piscinibacter sakaiensis]|uniref:Monooxygenase, FAD-binding n=1 Tax=Piscinibacter sakaiensis TaxID=1547922 RepID=A0A0K8P4U6_PISS1|nr:FAD-dependent monooxygenase [Piscinibacter sakaiensis]GAP37683.1 monooxygenase, FAD-binding [Piscinibacter sakaiensis]